ncbi:MAG: hypothetical protein PHC34_06110 [Candidatus Gastranaerophilales bacterium]|nr:hypothetical protein [Candidatus Gastranaerophilales bacterium]
MQENIKIYQQILKMKIYHNKFIARYGPLGEQRISRYQNNQDALLEEHEFHEDDYKETI